MSDIDKIVSEIEALIETLKAKINNLQIAMSIAALEKKAKSGNN